MVDEKARGDKSTDDDDGKKDTRVDMPVPPPPDGNWKSIDESTLYDPEKCDLQRLDLPSVYRILE